ncbi:sensor histidine kinase [Actinomadura rupiterrae]|uniref:sensor histidine kinase n=1 Tax=Actinomadura rupiterrae TaxID=559627 RepID=UPI0020A5AD89|nr:nitrate- and nitrite sensing domain-containing protein [Actinomadura rupiterrae]MCP2342121.1 signal transduction histidine kinase [Actinomadura rupiterrae]
MSKRPVHRRTRSIRARVLSIALIPVVAMLLIGFGLSGYLVKQGLSSQAFADVHRDGIPITSAYVADLEKERALTMGVLAGRGGDREELAAVRRKVDADLTAMIGWAGHVAQYAPQTSGQITQMRQYAVRFQSMRAALDAGKVSATDGFAFYNKMLEALVIGAKRFALVASNAQVAFENVVASDLFAFIESLAQAHSLGVYVQAQRTRANVAQFTVLSASYREPPATLIVNLTPGEQARFAQLLRSPEWAALRAGDAALAAGKKFDASGWDRASGAVQNELTQLYLSHSAYKSDLAEHHARSTLLLSVSVAAGVAVLTLLITLISLRSANRLVARLRRLRDRTLELADRDLPALMAKIGSGERPDAASAVPRLEFGHDEIGEVAEAFGKAQHAAVTAAVAEAETRHGVRAVFLNIAHRSQAIVHRQLRELDQIERSEDNPDLLDRLFHLDHLATRARRNAENLIILGGEKVGRQWRHPVSLNDVIRGAVSETKDYTRVAVGGIPDAFLAGSAVADVGHLLAELVDNGTSFSPPETRVTVRANIVGKGVAVEIEDQGLGIQPEVLGRLNDLLHQPPDFSFMALAGDLRIGLFVVAHLAAKYDIRVKLRESVYGGVQAVILLPSTVMVDERPAARPPVPPPPPRPALPEPPATGSSGLLFEPTELATVPGYPAEPETRDGPLQWGSAARRAPLPQRQAQNNLNPNLLDAPEPPPPAPVADSGSRDSGSHERSAHALAAFQRGTAQARADARTSAASATDSVPPG